MTKEDLQSFKIGDTRSPGISQPKDPSRKRQHDQQHETASLGFTRIEKILEDEGSERMSQELGELHGKIKGYLEGASSQREQAHAKQALAAVERTADLMDYLFQTKASIEANLGSEQKTQPSREEKQC